MTVHYIDSQVKTH